MTMMMTKWSMLQNHPRNASRDQKNRKLKLTTNNSKISHQHLKKSSPRHQKKEFTLILVKIKSLNFLSMAK